MNYFLHIWTRELVVNGLDSTYSLYIYKFEYQNKKIHNQCSILNLFHWSFKMNI